MRKSIAYISLSVISGLLAALSGVSCNTQGCTDNRSSIPLAQFYSYSTLESISLDSLEITGVGAPDSAILLGPGSRVSEIHLPMRASENSTSWCFAYRWKALDDERNNDTLTFVYDAIPYFASDECGAMYRYRITEVRYTRHLIDSVGVIDSLITNVNDDDINIYFRTADENTRSTDRHKIRMR